VGADAVARGARSGVGGVEESGGVGGHPMTRKPPTVVQAVLLASAITLVLGPPRAADLRAQPVKVATPVTEGTGRSGEFPTKWALYISPEATPGDTIVTIESVIGTIGKGGILTTTYFYFAGIEGRTLHLYRVELKDLKEQTRDPILLPLSADNVALLRVRPLFADRSFTLRLRLGADNLLTGVLAK
jgi:hypothetical protein